MIKDENLHVLLEQLLTEGEQFNFVNGKAEQKDFLTWIEKAREYFLTKTDFTEDRIERKFYHNDEDYFKLLYGYLTVINLDNIGLR